uniref:Fe2OG dioxygenase domain-containing protein n=1 Tax=Oryza brachyantha TaxID=4533 RepID=J3KZN9_ORYBR
MGSLPVPSVQAMVAANGAAHVPPRYLRPTHDEVVVAAAGESEIPVIDFRRLQLGDGEALSRLHIACQDWGFFQLINHSVAEDVMETMKSSLQGFFQLPAETKKQFAQEPGQLEGYGQLFVVSEDQKLDWADSLYVHSQPSQDRKLRFWPDQPAGFRMALDRYCAAVRDVADGLLAAMASNLGLRRDVITGRCGGAGGGMQMVRMQCYPPCAQADKVVGISPHSDADLVTILLQVNGVDGLHIMRNNGAWLPVSPLEGAFVVNVGDVLQVFTNGRYRSVEHRVVVDGEKERLSMATFHCPSRNAVVGPLSETVAQEVDAAYGSRDYDELLKLFFAKKLDGKSFLDPIKKNKTSG